MCFTPESFTPPAASRTATNQNVHIYIYACPVPALALFSAILQPGLSRVNGAGERRLASQCSIERPKTKEGREQLQARLLQGAVGGAVE